MHVALHFAFILGTFGIQQLDIKYLKHNKSICFKCVFNCCTHGCFIQYKSLDPDGLQKSINIPEFHAGFYCESIQVEGEYKISAYDLQTNGSVFSSRPAIEQIYLTNKTYSNHTNPKSKQLK